jgi:hypothetical protein
MPRKRPNSGENGPRRRPSEPGPKRTPQEIGWGNLDASRIIQLLENLYPLSHKGDATLDSVIAGPPKSPSLGVPIVFMAGIAFIPIL